MRAALARSLVVVSAKPLRAKSGRAAVTIASLRSCAAMRFLLIPGKLVITNLICQRKVSLHIGDWAHPERTVASLKEAGRARKGYTQDAASVTASAHYFSI